MQNLRRLLTAGFTIFLFVSLTRNLLEYRKNIEFYKTSREDYEAKVHTNQTLKTQILKENDPQEIEKTIRNKLNLSREGELVVIIPTPTPTPTPKIIPTVPVYRQWALVFFKN